MIDCVVVTSTAIRTKTFSGIPKAEREAFMGCSQGHLRPGRPGIKPPIHQIWQLADPPFLGFTSAGSACRSPAISWPFPDAGGAEITQLICRHDRSYASGTEVAVAQHSLFSPT